MGPQFLSMGVVSVFFNHLDGSKVPTDVSPNGRSQLADRAWLSLFALAKLGNFLQESDDYGPDIIKAWPSVFKWSGYFFAIYIQPKNSDPQRKKGAIDAISASWYSLVRSESARKVMTTTPGSIEMATLLWVFEDASPISSIVDIPSASAALDGLLREYHPGNLDRVVKAAGGKAENVAQTALLRLRSAFKNITRLHEPRTAIYLDLICKLSRDPNHKLRYAFLSSNIITLCTTIALTVTNMINDGGHPGLLDVLVASFGYLSNCLESTDGFSWVIQSVKAGLLTAFVDASPHFFKLDPDDRDMILHIVRDILPDYLVYRSVVEAVDGTMRKLSDSPHRERILSSTASGVWTKFHKLALERLFITMQATAVKGKAMTCDNVKCQKIDEKNNFRRCGACSTTLYCSKECQTVSWKEGGHKTMCALKQQERLEGKKQSISKGDAAFFHHLATRDAWRELPTLREMATKEYPQTVNTDLVVCIDYLVNPPKFLVVPIVEYDKHQPETDGTVNAEARNEALIERARENPGKFTVIQSKIANGQSKQLVLTIVTGGFWQARQEAWVEDDAEDDDDDLPPVRKNLDGVDMAMARLTLDGFLASRGFPPLPRPKRV